jgi:hypothetical protein
MAKMADFDSSGFQNIVLMLIGVLMMMLVSNVLTIISNPENIKIGALVTGSVYGEEDEADTFIPPKFQNMKQDPIYVDVEPTRLIIHPEGKVIEARDLVFEGNDFELFLDDVERVKSVRYIILLLRPGSATFQRKLRQVIRDRGIDVGFEPWDVGREIKVLGAPEPPTASPPPASDRRRKPPPRRPERGPRPWHPDRQWI